MFRYKTSKQAFVIAALVILLCLVCLIGATLALFTNDPNDGTIGIITTAGEVKADIVDDSAEQNSLVAKVLEFRTSSERKEILFEPGATFFTQGFLIKNVGDVSINFHLTVSEDASIDMEEFHKAFEVWISTSPTNPANAERLTEFVGHLDAGETSTDTYYLFVKMKESAGNEFQGKSYDGIGIKVFAVQGNANVKE
jgi:hypothetical protein